MLLQHQWSETQLTKLVSLDGAYPGPKMSFKLASLLHSGDFNAVFIKIYSVLQLGLKVPGGVGRRGRGLGRTIMEISCIYSPLPPSDDSDARNFIKPRRTSGDAPTWNLSIVGASNTIGTLATDDGNAEWRWQEEDDDDLCFSYLYFS